MENPFKQLVESPKIISISYISTIHKKRYVAFPKQNTWILISFDLNSVLVRQTSEKVAYKSGLDYPNNQRFARKISKISETGGVEGGGGGGWVIRP